MKILLIMQKMLLTMILMILIDFLCTSKSKSRKHRVRDYVLVHFCTAAAIKRPQALLRLLDNHNICESSESSKKTPSPLSNEY